MRYFPRTRRALRPEHLRRQSGAAFALTVLFAGWVVWMQHGTIALYAVSQQARLELKRLPVPVQTPLAGQITFAEVSLGRKVEKGDPILKLDATPFELQAKGLELQLRDSKVLLQALNAEFDAEVRAQGAVSEQANQSQKTASARVLVDSKNLEFKKQESRVVESLKSADLASGLDALHSNAELEKQRAQLIATSAQAALDKSTSAMSLRDREVRLASVRYAVAQGESEVDKLQTQLESAEYEIARRTVRAPAAGTLVDIMPLSPGMTITSDARVATILPEGVVRVVAFFAPQDSLGRVHAGQNAILRMDNFPWTQFGTVAAVVDEVGHEPRDGTIRVELNVTGPNAAIPMEHGLTARCEIEVERLSPFGLLLRTAGHWVTPSTAPTVRSQSITQGG
jgi:multidrug resistance efflux pump